MENPSDSGQSVLKIIVRHMDAHRFIANRPQTFLGYKEVHDELKLKLLHGMTYGDSLSAQGLAALAEWTKAEGHPAITGLIVNKTNDVPGPGYFNLFDIGKDYEDWWFGQIEAALMYNWKKFTGFSEPEPPASAPIAIDINPPLPERVTTTVSRIVRDTMLANSVKNIHRHKCQLCGLQLTLKEGWYSEAHHIQPLGTPHDGPDVIDNIICVCPNCHAQLDYGAISLAITKLPMVGHHTISQKYIDYHNSKIHSM